MFKLNRCMPKIDTYTENEILDISSTGKILIDINAQPKPRFLLAKHYENMSVQMFQNGAKQ